MGLALGERGLAHTLNVRTLPTKVTATGIVTITSIFCACPIDVPGEFLFWICESFLHAVSPTLCAHLGVDSHPHTPLSFLLPWIHTHLCSLRAHFLHELIPRKLPNYKGIRFSPRVRLVFSIESSPRSFTLPTRSQYLSHSCHAHSPTQWYAPHNPEQQWACSHKSADTWYTTKKNMRMPINLASTRTRASCNTITTRYIFWLVLVGTEVFAIGQIKNQGPCVNIHPIHHCKRKPMYVFSTALALYSLNSIEILNQYRIY